MSSCNATNENECAAEGDPDGPLTVYRFVPGVTREHAQRVADALRLEPVTVEFRASIFNIVINLPDPTLARTSWFK